jgi:hypothetical protein
MPNLLDLLPHKRRQDEQEERTRVTDAANLDALAARRDAEAEMIRAYKRLNMAYKRHDWSNR